MTRDHFWNQKIARCKTALEQNNFEVFVADDPGAARALAIDEILPKMAIERVSWGDSMTLYVTGLLDYFKSEGRFKDIGL